MSSIVLGLDPGLSGGIAVLHDAYTAEAIPTPVTSGDIDVAQLIRWIKLIKVEDRMIAYVEAVHAMPRQGVSSMFKFGYVTGVIHGVLRTLGIPLKLVTPQAWKKQILAGTAKDKQAAIEYCLRTYPNINLFATERSKVHHSGMADALCIAEYGYKKENL